MKDYVSFVPSYCCHGADSLYVNLVQFWPLDINDIMTSGGAYHKMKRSFTLGTCIIPVVAMRKLRFFSKKNMTKVDG